MQTGHGYRFPIGAGQSNEIVWRHRKLIRFAHVIFRYPKGVWSGQFGAPDKCQGGREAGECSVLHAADRVAHSGWAGAPAPVPLILHPPG